MTDSRSTESPATVPAEPSLADLLGGRRGALDATTPALAFVLAWLVADRADAPAVPWAAVAATVSAVAVSWWRLRRGDRPRAVLVGLLAVTVAVVIVLRTGRAVDFFALQIAANAASALAWLISITIRRPLLGIVVGVLLGQRMRWRHDPDLIRGYSRASWVWTASFFLRLAVFVPLYAANQVVALGVARVVLSWPLIATCIALSWPLIRSALPTGHPGIRLPRAPGRHPGEVGEPDSRSAS